MERRQRTLLADQDGPMVRSSESEQDAFKRFTLSKDDSFGSKSMFRDRGPREEFETEPAGEEIHLELVTDTLPRRRHTRNTNIPAVMMARCGMAAKTVRRGT